MAGQVDFDPVRALATLVVSAIGIWVIQTLYTAISSPLRTIPGPWISRFTNLRLKAAVFSGKRIFYIDNLHQQYGPIVRLSPTEVSVADVDGFKKVHGVTSKFVKDHWYIRLTNFPRHSVFTMLDPKTHAARRRLYARGFSKTYLREHWEQTVREKTSLAVSKIKHEALAGRADLVKWWTFMATDITGVIGFGESFGMLELGKKTEYIRILDKALVGNGIGADFPWLRSAMAKVPIRAIQEVFNSSSYLMRYGAEKTKNARSGNAENNFMASVIAEGEKEGGQLDDLDVTTESTSLIFAGSGTTANTMTYLCYAVLSRPQLQQALENEVGALNENFTDSDLEALPLLTAIIKETLRLYASVPGTLPRVVPKGGVTIDGHFIPEGYVVGTQAYTLHRDDHMYADPYKFDPDRWMPGSSQSEEYKATWCPFGAGAYSCLGQHLAYMVLRSATALFFRECRGARLAGSTTPESMEFENYFVITPKGHRCEVVLDKASGRCW